MEYKCLMNSINGVRGQIIELTDPERERVLVGKGIIEPYVAGEAALRETKVIRPDGVKSPRKRNRNKDTKRKPRRRASE